MVNKTGAQLLDSGERFSIAMWEYSYLLQRTGKQHEYADWDMVLDQVVERGYQCLRIDPFPHLLARGKDGQTVDEFDDVMDFNHMWTRFEPLRYRPREGVVEFMTKCRERGIYVALSSWYRHDTTGRQRMVQSPADYARIWIETLDILAEADLLDIVVYVDLCNEFPFHKWCIGPSEDIFDGKRYMKSAMGIGWTEQVVGRINRYFKESIGPIREAYPTLKYTFSSISHHGWNRIDHSALDCLDPHIWAAPRVPMFAFRSGFYRALLSRPRKNYGRHLARHIEKCMQLYPRYREKLHAALRSDINWWTDLGRERELPLVMTEGWATIIYEDLFHAGALGEWEWFKEVAEVGVKHAVDCGWQGICTSNFCQPHFEGMWTDVEWHQAMTHLIRNG